MDAELFCRPRTTRKSSLSSPASAMANRVLGACLAVWEWAKQHEFTIVSKDTDFHQRTIVFGHPPKFIWLRVGNCQTTRTRLITNLLRSRYKRVDREHQYTNEQGGEGEMPWSCQAAGYRSPICRILHAYGVRRLQCIIAPIPLNLQGSNQSPALF